MNRITSKGFINLLFLSILLAVSTKLQSQTTENGFQLPNFAPKSPEAAAFLKYGEYPVDLSTGVPSVSIPLYNVDIKDFKLPVTLDYHASGIKVNQEATWVGLGWNLNAGAQVILSARDDIDENNPYTDEIPNSDNIINYFNQHPYDHNGGYILNNHLDRSRVKDMYSFSSPTANGNFYIQNFANNEVVIIPPNAFKVELTGGDRSTMKFKITDPQGNIYTFNTTTEISERTMTHGDRYISAWYVDEIKTPANNKINFIYQDDGTLNDTGFSQRIEVKKIYSNYGCDDPRITDQISPVIDESSTTMTTAKKLKEIIFNEGNSKVVFDKINGRQDLINANGYLNKLEVKHFSNNQFKTVKGYTFDYSYFNSSGSTYNDKRLKLDRIKSLIEGEGHDFVYSDLTLPAKTSFQQDYFGYYNARGGQNLVPYHFLRNPFVAEVGAANREVNPAVNQAGILKEIHYPTRGWTKFNYETNQYFGVDGMDKYKLKVINSSVVQGTGNGTAEPKEGPGIEDEYIPQCKSIKPIDCVNYVKLPFEAINATGQLVFEMNNPVGNDPTLIKYQYARVRVIVNDVEMYNSGKLKASGQYNIPVQLHGSCFVLIEAYGNYMSIIGLQVRYVSEDLTPKNNLGSGLRIQSVENYNYDNTLLLKKQYDYSDFTNKNISSGKLINYLPTSFVSNAFTNYSFFNCPPSDPSDLGGCDAAVNYQITHNISSNSRYGIEGNTIVYRYVKEKFVDLVNNMNNGYTQYEFSTDADEIPFGNPTVQIATTWKRGKTKEKRIYKTIGLNDYLLQKETNTFFEDISRISYYKGFKMFRNATTNIRENNVTPLMLTCPYNALEQSMRMRDGIIEPVTFNIPIPWYYQKSSELTENFYNDSNVLTGSIITNKTFNYSNPSHLQLTSQTTTNSNGEVLETKFFYAPDTEMTTEPFRNELITNNMIGIPLDTQTFSNGVKLSEQKTVYDNNITTSNLLLPKYIYSNKGTGSLSATDKKITFDQYDQKGNTLQYTPEASAPVTIIWGYNKTQPIAKIEGSYTTIPTALITAAQTQSDTGTEADLLLALSALRNDPALANAMVSTYTYIPLVGVSTITDPKGDKITYTYDSLGRLEFVKDKNDNILSDNQYNYKQ